MSRYDPRLYLPALSHPFQAGHIMTLSEGQAHYLGHVLRLQPGATLGVFNGKDGEWQGIITALKKNRAVIELQFCTRPQETRLPLSLLFAPLKRDATELVIRMGTELGVTCFRPVVTERTNTHRLNYERLALIAQEAAEQCERLDVPAIEALAQLKNVLSQWPTEKMLAVALEREGADPAPAGADALLIGPEGGFSSREVAFLQAHQSVKCFSLGSLVLRAETASVVGLSQLGFASRLA